MTQFSVEFKPMPEKTSQVSVSMEHMEMLKQIAEKFFQKFGMPVTHRAIVQRAIVRMHEEMNKPETDNKSNLLDT